MNENPESLPKLRNDIELLPASIQGKRVVVARDSLGLIREPIVLQGAMLEFLSLIDGIRDIRDIQLALMKRRGGVLVSSGEVKMTLDQLDEIFLLDTPRYRRERERIVREYSFLEVREPAHAGEAYAAEPGKLRTMLDDILSSREAPSGDAEPRISEQHSNRQQPSSSKQPSGSDQPSIDERTLEEELAATLSRGRLAALVAPHIDLQVGRRVYASAYRAVKELSPHPPKRIVVLGTGHNLSEHLLSLTVKDFKTPLGRVTTDRDLVKRLKEAAGEIAAPDDIAHRSEHSIEFQIIFLQHLFGSDFTLLPVLTGSFHKILEEVSGPSKIPLMNEFLKTIGAWMEETPGETLLVAGVDLSHVGPKFGHQGDASYMLPDAKKHDNILIDAMCEGNLDEFWAEIKRAGNRYNVCGFSPIACLLELLQGNAGYRLDYDVWREEATRSAVTFTAAVFVEK